MAETLDDLQNGYYIYQDDEAFKFGMDAVLLADFAKTKARRAIDLCTGSGIIPILLAAKTDIPEIEAVEIHEKTAAMARRSVEYNGLSDRINIRVGDIKDAPKIYGGAAFDIVTVNPPYIKFGAGLVNEADARALARHEISCTIDDVARVSAKLLVGGGSMYMVHRPSRLADIFCAMRSAGIEPKCMRFVAPAAGEEAKLVLIRGRKGGGSELKIMPPLYVYDGNGVYSKELDAIYGR